MAFSFFSLIFVLSLYIKQNAASKEARQATIIEHKENNINKSKYLFKT